MTKDGTRALLLEHGTQLILERGYNATGILSVLAAAKVPKGSFYHFFKTKDEFGLAVLQRYFDALIQTVDQFLGDTTQAPLVRLRGCFDHYVAHFADRGCREGCLLGNLSQELADQHPIFRERLQQLIAQWTARVASCLHEAQKGGAISAKFDCQHLAEFCVTSWEGALLYMKATKDIRPVQNFLVHFFDVLLASS